MEPIKVSLTEFNREKAKMPAPPPRESTAYQFDWLLYKPQAHAIESFTKFESSRKENTDRK
jgi:hypothetical protein